MAKSLDVKPRPEDLDGVPVSLLGALDNIEQIVLALARDVEILKRIVAQNVGARMDGSLWKVAETNHDMIMNISGEALAISTVLVDQGLTTVDDLLKIKREKFDEPLREKIAQERARYEERMKEAQQEAIRQDVGIVTPTPQETSVILTSR